ncbi:TPA: tail fiber protein [Salmonella enterica]
MGKLTELEQWEEDVYQIETSDPVLGGPDGITNKPAKQLANRTRWLKQQLLEANNALAEHARSRNHPDASLVNKGFVKLYSGVTSMDETMAATPKAVKIAMDNASARLAKERNLADLTNIPLALQNLTLAFIKKAVEDAQIGLHEQPVMWINTADDLSNLAAGARRFAKNADGVTVLPSADYCYIEVLAKRDCFNGTCIQVIEYSNPGNQWVGTRNAAPVDTEFTWVRQYNESFRPPLQALPDSLLRGNNLSDLTNPAAGVRNLGLSDTVNRASHVYTDGNIYGTAWGGWLSAWLNGQLSARDSNINTRATTSWVNQYFVKDVRMGGNGSAHWGANGGTCPPGYVLTGGDFNDGQSWPIYAPVQKNINDVWYNVAQQ